MSVMRDKRPGYTRWGPAEAWQPPSDKVPGKHRGAALIAPNVRYGMKADQYHPHRRGIGGLPGPPGSGPVWRDSLAAMEMILYSQNVILRSRLS
jgi:hypothetical protein